MAEEKVEIEDLLAVGDTVLTRCEGRGPIPRPDSMVLSFHVPPLARGRDFVILIEYS